MPTGAIEQSAPNGQGQSAGGSGSSSGLQAWAQQYSVEATPLGRGSFASVYKAVNRATKEPVAIKVMTKARLGERALHMLAAEINILRTLEHPNVVCLRDSHSTERRILIVLEFCGGGDLGQFIQARGPSPESTARHFMHQLAAGLAFLRSRRLIHRDIKPQNLLLSEKSSRACLKIADFGLARHLPQGSLAKSMLGSPLYMAPEVLNSTAYDAKADLWSAGAVLYELVTAKHPFGGANQAELMNNIRRNRPRLPPGVTLSPSCVELLGMLLVPRPADRASLQTFLSCAFLNPDASASPPRAGTTSNGCGKQVSQAASPVAKVERGSRSTTGDATNVNSPSPSVQSRRSDIRLSRPSAGPSAAQGNSGAAPEGRGEPSEADGGQAGTVRTVERSGGRVHVSAECPSADDGLAAAAAAAAGGGGVRPAGEVREEVVGYPAGVRNGEWGWDWGGRGGVGGDGGEGQAIVMGLGNEGPLPALPALPFALGPFGMQRSFTEAGGGGGGAGAGAGSGGLGVTPSDYTFDLAFAGGPPGDRSPPAVAVVRGMREHRSLSANDAAFTAAAPTQSPIEPDWSRRKRSDAAAAAPAEVSTSAAPVATPTRRRSHSFSGQGSTPCSARLDRADASESPKSLRTLGAGRVSRSPGSGPDPVFYLGKGGSVPGPSASPRRHSAPVRRTPPEALGHAGNSTPPSPAYHVGRNGAGDVDGGSGGDAGHEGSFHSSPSTSMSRGVGQTSPGRGVYPPPVSVGHTLAVPSSSSPMEGNDGGAGDTRGGPADGAAPMLVKYPSFRVGGDSLLTIPEDSTGFVLVTRTSSISCEHGPNCECWAWSGGAGGGGAVTSPSASYLAAANPYGGPGQAAATAAASGERRAGGGGAFLGLGTIWNTAVNTFRGVAGAHGRRSSWPTRRGGAAGQQQRGSMANAPSPPATVPGGQSSREQHLSPHSAQYRKMSSVGVASPSGSGGPGRGSSSNSSSSGSGGRRGGGGGGSRGPRSDNSSFPQGALVVDSRGYRVETPHHGGGDALLSSPTDEAMLCQQPPPSYGGRDHEPRRQSLHDHQRRHSDPCVRQSYPSELERESAGDGGDGNGSRAWTAAEDNESQRVNAAADRAEVVGKRSILVVTLADKTAQEAMSLALESPRDARAAAGAGAEGTGMASAGGASYARRRHDMLTEALALYVKALAILQGALPGVLVECDGLPTDDFAAWNPLGSEQQQHKQHLQQQKQQRQRLSRPSPSSSALSTERSVLVKKAAWLKDLFSQILQRAEHCRAQASVAANAAANAAAASSQAVSGAASASSKDSGGPGQPWAAFVGRGGGGGGSPQSDTAAAALYRSAMEHGQEAAVCYLLGRSDAATAHYVRACALLQLLALEPEMAGVEESPRSGAGGEGGRAGMGEEETRQQGRSGGWQEQLLLMADGYARRVELINRGDANGGQQQRACEEEGRGSERRATAPPGFVYTT